MVFNVYIFDCLYINSPITSLLITFLSFFILYYIKNTACIYFNIDINVMGNSVLSRLECHLLVNFGIIPTMMPYFN